MTSDFNISTPLPPISHPLSLSPLPLPRIPLRLYITIFMPVVSAQLHNNGTFPLDAREEDTYIRAVIWRDSAQSAWARMLVVLRLWPAKNVHLQTRGRAFGGGGGDRIGPLNKTFGRYSLCYSPHPFSFHIERGVVNMQPKKLLPSPGQAGWGDWKESAANSEAVTPVRTTVCVCVCLALWGCLRR